MNKPTVLRNSAEPEIVLGIALKIYYKANDWVSNATFLDKLDIEYDAIGKERESRTGGQAVAKYKPSLYYGLIDCRPEDDCKRINDFGIRYYEAYQKGDNDSMVDCLISSIIAHTFGRNNAAVPNSDSSVEPPKVFLLSSILLGGIDKSEYAYILEQLSQDKDYHSILVQIMISRQLNKELFISDYAKNNYKDDKGLKFLADAGLFDERNGRRIIKEKYIIKYQDVIARLSIFNDVAQSSFKFETNEDTKSPSTSTNYDKYLRALRTKPFMLLAGISGTGKSRIVRELAFRSCPEYLQDKDKTMPGNYCMIEVKPNWHDSSEIIGYYSNINKQYQFSRFVKFLVKAMMFPKVPFFVCLDEMNLAPVEQYFAEFLSILETRKKSGDNIQTGVLVEGKYFHEIGVTGCKNNGEVYMKLHETNLDYVDADCATATSLIENGLTLPDNVFVIGTVNMDDTTHQFSRKVIDRAMTIEMNGGKLSEMFGHSSDLEYLPTEQVWKLDIFQPKHVNADEVVANNPDATQIITEELPKQLDAINDVLRDTPFQVSYRVLNEMVIYFSVLVESGMPSEEAKNLAVDQMLLMKILPRIEGDRDMLMLDAQTCRLDKLEPFAASEDTKKKIAEMKNRLNKQEFTRFWP